MNVLTQKSFVNNGPTGHTQEQRIGNMRIKEVTKKMFYEAMSPYGDDLYAVGGFGSCE